MNLPRNDRGAVMVEFGLAVIPFSVLVVLMLEVFLTVTQQHFLEAATQRAAHSISMTGDVSESAVRSNVCSGGLMLYSQTSCEGALKVGIQAVKNTSMPYALTPTGDLNAGAFNSAVPAEAEKNEAILLIRTAIPAPLTGVLADWLVSGSVTRISPYAKPASN